MEKERGGEEEREREAKYLHRHVRRSHHAVCLAVACEHVAQAAAVVREHAEVAAHESPRLQPHLKDENEARPCWCAAALPCAVPLQLLLLCVRVVVVAVVVVSQAAAVAVADAGSGRPDRGRPHVFVKAEADN